jgi:pyridoxine 5-phosphate synthase
MLRLGVNVDHIATLRNARGGSHPDPLLASLAAIAAGADGITTHLREDRRHIRDSDIKAIRAGISVPLNFEMAATDEMVRIALEILPNACCLVPEKRTEVTTEGGLDVAGQHNSLRPMVAALRGAGIRVSLFVDPSAHQLRASADVGADIVELHTGAYAHAEDEGDPVELARLQAGATLAVTLGLEVHAGHGLTYANVSSVAAIPEVMELNIGHYIIGQAVFDGLPTVIHRYRWLMNAARS